MNKVKSFYIRGLTKEQQAKVIDKAIQAGANPLEGILGYHEEDDFNGLIGSNYVLVGVDCENDTVLQDYPEDYRSAIEITLHQLDEHLGVSPKTPDNKCTELRNVKIDLRKEDGTVDEELSEAFQRAVFASGGKWNGDTNSSISKVCHTDHPYLFVTKDGTMTCCIYPQSFEGKDTFKQISFKSITTWEAEYVPEPKEEETKRNIVSLPDGTRVYQDELEALISSSKNLTIIEEE